MYNDELQEIICEENSPNLETNCSYFYAKLGYKVKIERIL